MATQAMVTLGSIIPAQAIEHPMREIVNVISQSGLTPDANDNEQLYKALRRLCAPAGEIRMWGGNHIPDGFLHCNGQAIDRTIYADLFAAIGTTHGNGNSSTTFNLPDIRNKFVAGADSSNNKPAGNIGGSFSKTVNTDGHALTIDEMPSHSHAALLTNISNSPPLTVDSRVGDFRRGNGHGADYHLGKAMQTALI